MSGSRRSGALAALLAGIGCNPAGGELEPAVVRLDERIAIEGEAAPAEAAPPLEWRFDEAGRAAARARAELRTVERAEAAATEAQGEGAASEASAPDPLALVETGGFEAFLDVPELAIRGDRLVGRAGEVPVLRLDLDLEERDDDLHAVVLELRVSAGERAGLRFEGEEELDRERTERTWRRSKPWLFSAAIEPSVELRTVSIELAHGPRESLGSVRHLFLQPTDAPGADFELASVRLVTRAEHLAAIPAGVSWQGLAEIYRQTLVLRTPGAARVRCELPSQPWLELHVGTLEPEPVTFRVTLRTDGGDERVLLRRTVTTPDRWEDASIELGEHAGELVELELALESPHAGALGFFGTLAVRNRGAVPFTHAGAVPLARAGSRPPRGVIVLLVDTLRRDHLEAYGYERETAPTIARLAREGALFLDDVAQGTWTKVSVPSLLTSLYPATLGIVSPIDRLPAEVTTLAEAYQQAGYATFATSSVFFTGRLSRLEQGLDVLHERASFPEVEHSDSKTARIYVDRLLEWIEQHRDSPFYARLHVFDPHDPFEPYAPYDELWSEPDAKERHERDVEAAEAWLEAQGAEVTELPSRAELTGAGLDPDAFVRRELDWYDASIRALDVELARLFEGLEQLGLAEDVLVAFVSDHGEEFLDHGRHFHGDTTYAEMTNVPLVLWGPGRVPAGLRIEDTVQSIDLMPTLLELSGLAPPEGVHGQSLVPLLGGPGAWTPRPAFAERRRPDTRREPEPHDVESFAIVEGDWRLIHNVTRPEGRPEFELYDRRNDPREQRDLAAEEPERVAAMAEKLRLWRAWAESLRVDAGEDAELSAADLAELQKLGYAR